MTVNDQGGGVIQWDTKDISPTLRSQMKHHEPIAVLEIHEDTKITYKSNKEFRI